MSQESILRYEVDARVLKRDTAYFFCCAGSCTGMQKDGGKSVGQLVRKHLKVGAFLRCWLSVEKSRESRMRNTHRSKEGLNESK